MAKGLKGLIMNAKREVSGKIIRGRNKKRFKCYSVPSIKIFARKKRRNRLYYNQVHKSPLCRNGIPHPIIKKCSNCNMRVVKYHHYLCPKCWEERRKQQNKSQ